MKYWLMSALIIVAMFILGFLEVYGNWNDPHGRGSLVVGGWWMGSAWTMGLFGVREACRCGR